MNIEDDAVGSDIGVLKVLEIEKQGKKYKVSFDKADALVLYASEIKEYGLREDVEIDDGRYEMLVRDVVGLRAKKRAMHLLEKRDYTSDGLRKKLESGDYPKTCVESAIEYVSSYGYLDDLRYSLNYIEYHRESKSQNSIRLDLIKRGVDKDTIEKAFAESEPPTEDEQILRLLEKKHFEDVRGDQKEKYRIYQFLLRKGYRSEDVLRLMK